MSFILPHPTLDTSDPVFVPRPKEGDFWSLDENGLLTISSGWLPDWEWKKTPW